MKNGWKENIVEGLSLPKDLVYGSALLTITGQQEILVENYRGILVYEKECICIQAKHCRIRITGRQLHINYYTQEEMKISGLIQSIEYE